MNKNFSPKVSVIIPLYNAEKYIGVCLSSILVQTLRDFEVIAVDDCSTDSSLPIVESFSEKFGERLKIITLPENTGSGAVPRNVGLTHARGKYVFFMDADDFIISTALERLYTFAEAYQVDAVYMEKYLGCNEELVPKNLKLAEWKPELSNENPMLESEQIAVRVERFLHSCFWCAPWAKLLNRKFLIDNEITFPHMKIAEDVIWTFKIICLAEKILRIPSRLYVNRENSDSMTQRKRTPEQEIIFWTSPLLIGADCLEQFMSSIEFFVQNPAFRFRVLNYFVSIKLDFMAEAFGKLTLTEVYETFLHEFSKAGSTRSALISYLLVMNHFYRNELRSLT